jgi:hypothetical protein
MAFAAVASTKEPRAFSVGPLHCQIFTWSAASGDTSGTITASNLKEVSHIVIDGKLYHTAAPTFSGNVVTLAFTNPGATVYGTALVYGKK